MMIYEYRCSMKHVTEREFVMGQAKERMRCPICRNIAKRIISNPSAIFTDRPFSDARENRIVPVGHSERFAIEEQKQYDRMYDASYKESAPAKPSKMKSMLDTAQEMGIPLRS